MKKRPAGLLDLDPHGKNGEEQIWLPEEPEVEEENTTPEADNIDNAGEDGQPEADGNQPLADEAYYAQTEEELDPDEAEADDEEEV